MRPVGDAVLGELSDVNCLWAKDQEQAEPHTHTSACGAKPNHALVLDLRDCVTVDIDPMFVLQTLLNWVAHTRLSPVRLDVKVPILGQFVRAVASSQWDTFPVADRNWLQNLFPDSSSRSRTLTVVHQSNPNDSVSIPVDRIQLSEFINKYLHNTLGGSDSKDVLTLTNKQTNEQNWSLVSSPSVGCLRRTCCIG